MPHTVRLDLLVERIRREMRGRLTMATILSGLVMPEPERVKV
jgi:hypothetical protein